MHSNLYKWNNLFIILFSILCFPIFAQEVPKLTIIKVDHSYTDWYKEAIKANPNYIKVKELYDAFFQIHPYEKSIQKSFLRRWFQINANNVNAVGDVQNSLISATESAKFIKANRVNNSQARKSSLTTSPFPAWNDMTGDWRMLGPYHAKNTTCNNSTPNMSGGFCDRVYINPYNTNNLFAGQSYGGLWVSKDKGQTWKLTDAEFPNGKNTYANRDMYYGEIEAHKTNANLVFSATEAGILKSTNGGDSWVLLNDLNYTTRSTERAYWLAPSNHDTNMLLASYGKKIYRSTDGGSTWKMVFDNSAGGANLNRGQHSTDGIYERWYNFCGLAFHPTMNNVVYLGAYNASNQACIYKSVDYGQTWVLMVNTNNTNWLSMQITPAAPNKIYFFELFNFLDIVPNHNTILKYDNTTGALVQELKYPAIKHSVDYAVISETDSSVMYIGGYFSGEVHKSKNGGSSFTTNNPGYTSCPNYIHPDIRAFSAVGDNVLIGTDGGTYLSENGMTTVKTAGKWISAADLWGFSSAFKDDIMAVGCDHGPTKIRLFDGDAGWQNLGGADAADVTVNPVDPRWIYVNDGYNRFRSFHDYKTVSARQPVVTANYKYLAFDPNLFTKVYPTNKENLMLSTDNMVTANNLYTFSAGITKVKIALKNPSLIYVLVGNNIVYKSINSGTSFSLITPNSTVTGGQANISDIDINSDGTTIWLSYGNVQTICKVVKSTNSGSTWTNYSTGLPAPTASNIAFQRGTNGGVYLSTNGGGVWYRDNSTSAWSLLGNGLPTLSYVTSMFLVPNKNALRMGTSRGIFEHNLVFTSIAEAQISADRNTAQTCNIVHFRDYSAYSGNTNIKYQWTFQGGSPAISTLENPDILYTNLGTYNVSLTVTDALGNVSTQTLNSFMNITASSTTCDPCSTMPIPILK